MTHVIVFGKSGQVAASLQKMIFEKPLRDYQFTFLSSQEVNFLDLKSVLNALDYYKPNRVINTSAYTAVDKAESEREKCELVNAESVKTIANWCAKNKTWLIHYSSDYVYDGSGDHFRNENEPTNPLSWYGKTKLWGDQAIIASQCQHVIFRTSWVYSEFGHNFVKTMLRLANEKSELKIVDDQIGSPTYAKDIAEFTYKSLQKIENKNMNSGIYNLVNEGVVSWFGFANEIFSQAQKMGSHLKIQNVYPISSVEFPTPAKRPLNSRLNLAKLKQEFNCTPRPWQEALKECLKHLFEMGRQ